MKERLNLIGAITAHVIFVSSIVTFLSRLFLGVKPGHWVGIPILLMAFPLVYLLIKAQAYDRPRLYYVQIGLMLIWLVALFVLDYLTGYDFRQTQWMVIAYVMLYFAGMGGMIGISAKAGRNWAISATLLFLVAGILAFVQRAITGI
jgi:uncharacterized membrane protein AbrB (regulator of aidB expression)